MTVDAFNLHPEDTRSPIAAPVCPLDLVPLRSATTASHEDVRRAVLRARDAQTIWRQRDPQERAAALRAAAKRMLARRHEVIELVRAETGKVDAETMFNEALGPLDAVEGWARVIREHAGREIVRLNPVSFPGKSAWIDLLPRGVVGILAPWNFPVSGLYRSVFPALLTGNAVVLKPSEYTPRSSGWLVEVLSTELPDGLITTVQGDGEVGAALLGSGIDACVFTGSSATGRTVRMRCADLGIPSSIEMGGKDAAIVLADCDLRRTVAGITTWALANAGQACGAVEVAYVDDIIADAFVERLADVWQRLRAAPGPLGEVDVAPLANRRQFEIVKAQVEDARARGAVVVCGGRSTGRGLWYEPTILDHCRDGMAVVQDETFGPVLAVVRVSGAADAVRRIHQGRYGLGTSIWTQDIDRANRIAERLDVGVVTINNHALSGAMPQLPWSGTRETGHGVANSRHSLLTFVRPRTTVVDRSSAMELYWLPYDSGMLEFGDILCDLQRGVMDRAWRVPLLLAARLRRLKNFFAERGGQRGGS